MKRLTFAAASVAALAFVAFSALFPSIKQSAHAAQAAGKPPRSDGSPAVALVSVTPEPGLPGFARYTFRNNSEKPVEMFYYAQDDRSGMPFTFYYDPPYLRPGETFTTDPRDASAAKGSYVAAVVFADGSVEGVGRFARAAGEMHRDAVAAFARYAKLMDEAKAVGDGDEAVASKLGRKLSEDEGAALPTGAEIARRTLEIKLGREGAAGVARLREHARALGRTAAAQ